jgi:putative FmdB family regulatory protein
MPAYSYRCEQCGKRFTRVEPISAHSERTPPCPKCRSKRVQRVFGSFFAKTSRKS